MANSKILWNVPATVATVLSTELNSLTNTSARSSSLEVTNSVDLLQYGQYELALASAAFPANGYVSLWHINNVSTGYETFTTASLPRPAEAIIPLSVLTGPQTASSAIMLLPPNDFKVALKSDAGVSLAASGNTLKLKRFVDRAVEE